VSLSAWLPEFKRRRIFRALVGYGLFSFAILQVVEPVMHGLDLPVYLDFFRGRLAAYDGRDDAAVRWLDRALAAQRAQVVDMLCGPKRLSETWQPAPETCAGYGSKH
jgi:hypothetical protein